jgi:hypothetical protein
VLRDQDQKLSAIVTINRQHGADVALGVEIQTHRDQIEDTGGEGGFQDRFSVIADPVVGRQDVYYAHEPGTPCSTCRPIDSVCALIGDRC